MKKQFALCLCAALLLILTAACGQVEKEYLGEPEQQTGSPESVLPDTTNGQAGLTYSNLAGEQVQDEVKNVMLAGGISREAAEKFFVWVRDFNQVMRDCESYDLQDDFVTIEKSVMDYGDYGPMSRLWYKTNQRAYSDILCRIAAFQLMKDHIEILETLDSQSWECYADTQWLYSDWDAISGFPLVDFSEEETGRYFTLYNPITAEGNLSEEEMFQAIAAEWGARGIRFTDGPVSLITAWIQYENQIAAAHAAVLIEDGGIIWLVEKTNPQAPYQAAKFSAMEQIKEYMYESIHAEDVRYGEETGVCIVLQNDDWLE